MLKRIAAELKRHIPFTALGAASGIIIIAIVSGNVPPEISQTIFYTLHPLHVVLSAMVTTAMYTRYRRAKIWWVLLIGWTGSIGIATLSDAIIPYLGGALLHVEISFHVPFIETTKMPVIGIEKWRVVNCAALLGIALGYWKPATRIPHFGHVLLSTWTSLFYFTSFGYFATLGVANWLPLLPFIFLFLFLAVWVPCCTSDIVYPLLFIRGKRAQPPPDEEH